MEPVDEGAFGAGQGVAIVSGGARLARAEAVAGRELPVERTQVEKAVFVGNGADAPAILDPGQGRIARGEAPVADIGRNTPMLLEEVEKLAARHADIGADGIGRQSRPL